MGFRDRKKSFDEREKARREERRKALSARLGGSPDQPGRSQAERDEKARRSQRPKTPAEPTPTSDATAKTDDANAKKRAERPRADRPTRAPELAKAGRKQPSRRRRAPKRRFWQRGAKPK